MAALNCAAHSANYSISCDHPMAEPGNDQAGIITTILAPHSSHLLSLCVLLRVKLCEEISACYCLLSHFPFPFTTSARPLYVCPRSVVFGRFSSFSFFERVWFERRPAAKPTALPPSTHSLTLRRSVGEVDFIHSLPPSSVHV